MTPSWASAGFSQQSGTGEALCKSVSNEERKSLQVEVLGGPLVEVSTSLGRSEWPACVREGVASTPLAGRRGDG